MSAVGAILSPAESATQGPPAARNRGTCSFCGRAFRRREHLERHLRTHTKEKPFLCHCGANFTRRDLLTRHVRLNHSKHSDQKAPCNAPRRRSTADRRVSEDSFVVYVPPTVADVGFKSRPQSRGSAAFQACSPSNNSIIKSPCNVAADREVQIDKDVVVPSLVEEQRSMTLPTEIYDTCQAGSVLNVVDPANCPIDESLELSPEDQDHFNEFTNFLDLIGLPAEWAPGLLLDGSSPIDTKNETLTIQMPTNQVPGREENHRAPGDITTATNDDSPFRAWLPSVPSNEQGIYTVYEDTEHPQANDRFSRLKVDENQRMHIVGLLEQHRKEIQNFQLPSRHTLTRYLTSFFQGFHMHLLFIHLPTFRLTETSAEFILAMMAAGAQYRFEHQNARRFFETSRSIVLWKLQRQASMQVEEEDTGRGEAKYAFTHAQDLEIIRTLMVLMGYATWEGVDMLQEAFYLRNILIDRMRLSGLEESKSIAAVPSPASDQVEWLRWVAEESNRRTKLTAFGFIEVFSIAYNAYPTLRNHEIKLRLPCATRVWNACNAAEWSAARQAIDGEQLTYHEALSQLLRDSNSTTVLTPTPSPLGNYYILHGILQRIHIIRELSLDLGDSSTELPADEVTRMEKALHSWTLMWQQAPESSLDPANENGSIPFTSSSLLALAYVRLSLNLGPWRRLETRDPACIATALREIPPLRRSSRMIPALIYSIHTVSIPIRLGVDYVSRSQAFFWSVRHALSSFECVVFLTRWLLSLAAEPNPRLSSNEKRILRWSRLVVEEAYDSMDLAEDESLPGPDPQSLAFAVLAIWSRFFRGNTQWQFINILGESLSRYTTALLEPGPPSEVC